MAFCFYLSLDASYLLLVFLHLFPSSFEDHVSLQASGIPSLGN
jgi:hypothetical protein